MEVVGVQQELWLEKADDEVTVIGKPDAPYVLSDSAWVPFCKIIRDLKFPAGFTSSLETIFEEGSREVNVQKSHNLHIDWKAAYKRLKNMVKFLGKPEANMANCYVWREAVTLATEENKRMAPKVLNRCRGMDSSKRRKYAEGITLPPSGKSKTLSDLHFEHAYSYIVNNLDEVKPWYELFRSSVESTSSNCKFADWFTLAIEHATKNHEHSDILTEDVISLASAYSQVCTSYNRIVCNGIQFNVQAKDEGLKTCNSLVSAEFEVEGEKRMYVGIIKDIIVIDCIAFTTELVECTWFECDTGVKDPSMIVDEDGFTLINTRRVWKKEDQPEVVAAVAKADSLELAENAKQQAESPADATQAEAVDAVAVFNLRRAERKALLLAKERDGLKAILASYDEEEHVIASHQKSVIGIANHATPEKADLPRRRRQM
ncbi:unnamed protein product [Calypogeia fissa]